MINWKLFNVKYLIYRMIIFVNIRQCRSYSAMATFFVECRHKTDLKFIFGHSFEPLVIPFSYTQNRYYLFCLKRYRNSLSINTICEEKILSND